MVAHESFGACGSSSLALLSPCVWCYPLPPSLDPRGIWGLSHTLAVHNPLAQDHIDCSGERDSSRHFEGATILRADTIRRDGAMTKELRQAVEADEGASQLLHNLRDLVKNARQRALRAVDAVQVQTCWEIGRHIVQFEQR